MTGRLAPLRDVAQSAISLGVVSLGSGVVAASNGLAPTGSTAIDVVLVTLGVGAWSLLASSAPIPAVAGVLVLATALTASVWTIPVGAAALLLALAWRDAPPADWRRAVIAGATAQVLSSLRPLGAFGVSTLIGVSLGGTLAYLGWKRCPVDLRRVLGRSLAVLGAGAVVLLLGFVLTAGIAASPLVRGGREARASLRLIDQGEIDAAIEGFSHAAARLRSADRSLDAWWGVPARALPLVAQQQRSVRRLADAAANSSAEIATILRNTDYDALAVTDGRINLAAISALAEPLGQLEQALDGLELGVAGARGDWVLPPINSVINRLSRDVVKRQTQLVDVKEAIRRAPDMLGASGVRRYFIALTTPAESRGLGGLMGNWAEVTADRGKLTLTHFGRHEDLLRAAPRPPTLRESPPGFLDRYSAFVLSDPDTLTVGPGVWTNLTVSAHFPWVAETIAELYPQSGGAALDGVFVMDVYAIAQLMRITGSVAIDSLGVEITPDNALQYLLRDQYLVEDKADRVDLLETLARTTIDRSLSGALPSPPKLAALMSPMARQHRLAAWARRPEEQAVLRNANMTKELVTSEGDALIGYSLYNGNGNKIDAYLQGSVEYDVDLRKAERTVNGTLRISLRNAAPASGLPDYVIGNLVDLPRGTNRVTVTLYSSAPIVSVTDDQFSVSWVPGNERGLYTADVTVEIPPGGSVTLTAETAADPTTPLPSRLVVDSPPTAVPLPLTVRRNGSLLTTQPLPDAGTYRFPLA